MTSIHVDAVPLELRERPQWVAWRCEERDGKSKKVPYRANGGGRASTTDPGSWSTFDEALAACAALPAEGVGYVFADSDPYVGVDLDDGLSEADRGAVVLALNSYSETSVSGNGVHVIIKASLNGHGRHPPGFGVFDRARFFVVTGRHVRGTPQTIEERQEKLDQVLAHFLPPSPPPAPRNPRGEAPVDVDDEELLERAQAARNGDKFAALWAGHWEGLYGSQSEADSALCLLLGFWTGRDHGRVDRLFRHSGLMREKWDSRRGEDTYGGQTIARALACLTDVYRDRGRPPPPPDEPDNRTNASEAASIQEKDVQEAFRTAAGQPPPLAFERDLLARFRADLRRAGVAGEERLAQVLYLALTSRVLPWGKPSERPISVLAKGTSSTGKSHTIKTVLKFFPASAYVELGSMSKRYLFYSEEGFEHRFVVVPEWASVKEDDEIVALLRVLLSEGRVIHGTVDGDGKRTARRIEKNGPTGLLVTTTEAAIDAEMETRLLALLTDDSAEQTRNVFKSTAALEDEDESGVDFEPWHELQRWIGEEGETRVHIPFVKFLAELMPTTATRLRRDFVTLLCGIRAHAILYQAQRERDHRGRIVATLEGDYAPIAALVGELIAESVEATVPVTMVETVAAVQEIIAEGRPHASPKALTDRLGVGRSATYDRIHRALVAGYLVNEAPKDERGMKLATGAALPSSRTFLPSVAEIVRATSGEATGRENPDSMRAEAALSGCPARPDEADGESLRVEEAL